jgi:hypothetical protein
MSNYKFYSCNSQWEINTFNGFSFIENQKPVPFSKQFCEFFSEKFEECFVLGTGIKPSSKVGITKPNRFDSPQLYEVGIISKLNPVLWIMPDYYFDISFCWQSKSEKIVQPWDEDFDISDLNYWMEGLKPTEYWKILQTEKKYHPFKVGKLPYELKVFEFGVDTKLVISLSGVNNAETIKECISDTINNYNEASLKNNRANGIAHNCRIEQNNNMDIIAYIDTGSAGIEITKAILKALKTFNEITLVSIDL